MMNGMPITYYSRNRIQRKTIRNYGLTEVEEGLNGRIRGFLYRGRARCERMIPKEERIPLGMFTFEEIIEMRTSLDAVCKLLAFYGITSYQLAEITTVPVRNIQRWTSDSESGRKCPDYVLNMMKIVLDVEFVNQ